MIDDNQNKKLDDALTLINDARLTRSEAYELFFNLKERIFSDQPSKVMCHIKHLDYDKAVDDYWDGTYAVPDGWANVCGDKE
jgi:hypothetical protein